MQNHPMVLLKPLTAFPQPIFTWFYTCLLVIEAAVSKFNAGNITATVSKGSFKTATFAAFN